MYIYQADTWCDSCGQSICRALEAKGLAPENPDDEYSYDSGEYPKWAMPESTDGPDHCAAMGECLEAIDLRPYGAREDSLVGAESVLIGALIGDSLTDDGVEYLRGMLAEIDGSNTLYQIALHHYWREVFGDQL